MKRISPLELLKNRKIRKYEDGGDVVSVEVDDSEYDIPPEPVVYEDISVDPESSAEGQIDIASYLQQYLQQATEDGLQYSPSAVSDLYASIYGASPLGAMPAQQSTTSQASPVAQNSTESGGLNKLLSGFSSLFSSEPKTPAQKLGMSEEAYAKLDPEKQALYAMIASKQQPEQSTFQKILQLGLVGAGGLASYSDAKSKNKALEKAYARNDQQNASYDQAKQRLNLPGGYASLRPYQTQNVRPV